MLALAAIQRSHGESQLARPAVARRGALRDDRLLVELADLDPHRSLGLVAPDRERHLLAGLDRRDQRRNLARELDVLAVDREDHVARLDAGRGGRAARL